MAKNAYIVFAAGGTGGHLFPAIAVASALHDRHPGATIVFVGGSRGLETRLVPQAGFPLRTLPLSGLKGSSLRGRFIAASAAALAVVRCLSWFLRRRPALVVGAGGYASGPAVLAAWLLRVPTMLMEQNHFPGATNRWLAPRADAVCLPSELAKQRLGGRGLVTGNPVRAEFAAIGPPPSTDRTALLVFGGSRGARSINRALVAALPRLAAMTPAPRVVHQTGPEDQKAIAQAYARCPGLEAEVQPFLDDMPRRLADADLVVCRAGATTLAELAAAGRPAILVPFPFAADDHQRANAEAVRDAGAALMVEDRDLDGARFTEELVALASDRPRRERMAAAARTLARLDATERIADVADALLEGKEARVFRKARQIHFVGVGGSGMSGIAEVLVNLGYNVSGSDLQTSDATRRLKRLRAKIFRGHRAEHVAAADVVVVSSAVRPENPEIVEARRRKIPVIPRAEMLAEIMRMKYGVAVAGAHGKTSTTAMIASVLTAGGLDPTVVIGGRVKALRSGAKLGKGEFMVAEADESDGSFLKMKPTIAVVTNVDREHLDHYKNLGAIQDAFVQFLSRVPFYGAAVVCLDEPNLRALLARVDRKLVTYGLSSDADLVATDVVFDGFSSSYVARWRGGKLGAVRIPAPGRHSVYNSLAAVAVGLELDVPFGRIAKSLARFQAVDRRFQRKGEAFGTTVIDDYGHHPTEIQATLAAAREGFGARTLVAFQPHRYSRTRALLEEFGRAFVQADRVIVTAVYAAGEPPIPDVDGAAVADALVRHGHPAVSYEPRLDRVAQRLKELVLPGDLVITLGAGDVWKVGETFLALGSKGHPHRAGRAGKAR